MTEAPPQGPHALVAHDEVAGLRLELNEKLKLLIQRERDVHTLLRRLDETYRWIATVADLASRIAALSSRAAALQVLVETLVSELGFAHARAIWGDIFLESAPIRNVQAAENASALLHARGEPMVRYVEWPACDALREAYRLEIPSHQAPQETIIVVVGRCARTAAYQRREHEAAIQRLQRLAAITAHAFDEIRLKMDLIAERDRLQMRVEEATKDLRRALTTAEDARREAEHAARVRGEFLANMSHEIRTPMTAVLGYADLLLSPNVTRAQEARYVETIRRSGTHLLQILDDILDLARLESGRFFIDKAPASLVQLLHEVLSLLNVRAAEKGLRLDLEFATAIPDKAIFDAARLRQILINLVGNAIKFTEDGGVTIRASLEPRGESGVFRVAVDDTGIGVPADRATAIFESFEQANAGAARVKGGAGLGLAISRRLAHLMGGDIQLEPKDGPGSRFAVEIAVGLVPDAVWQNDVALVTSSDSEPENGLARLHGRILVIEDTPLIQEVIKIVLRDAGAEVHTANLGSEALPELVRTRGAPYDLIFMDMQMPQLDGYETTRRLRAAGVQVPIVALTAHAMAGDRERCLDAGCDDYMTKPIERPLLIATAARFLARSLAPPSPAVETPAATPGGDAVMDVVAAMVPEFIEELTGLVPFFQSAQRRGDWPALEGMSHRLRGTASLFGFKRLSLLAAELEETLRRGETGRAGGLFDALIDEASVVVRGGGGARTNLTRVA